MAKAALFSKFGPAFALIVAALVLDQIVKQLVEAYLPLQEMVPVVPFLALYRVAFSMLSDMHGWFIVSMRLVIVVFVLWLWRKTAADRTFAHLGFAFIIAGAAGNLLDRFFYGHVIDYILFHTDTWSFAVFNLADTFITIGAGCVILDEFLHARAAKK